MLNRTPLPNSVLYFANPAVHANEQYEVLFPPDVAWATFHSKVDFAPWPLARGPFMGIHYKPGTNLGFWKNHPHPVSFFVYHSDLDFLGGYDHGRRAGVVHVADHDTVPGKKFWTWGNGPDGRMWDQILTDEDGPYIELMTGGYSDNQPDYSWIQPGERKAVVQRWFPMRELGGLKAANAEAALNLELRDSRARLAVNTTSRRPDARVRLTAGGRVLFDEKTTLAPDAPLAREASVPAGVREEELRLVVTAADGSEILSYQPRPRPKTPEPPRYLPPPAPAQLKSVEELVLAGQRLEQFYNPSLEPEPYYREALRRDPGDARANTRLGAIALRQGRYEEAERLLEKAVARLGANHTRARDGEAQYLLGLALVERGRTDAARDALAAAAWDLGWTGAALLEQARLESARGNAPAALELVTRSLAASPDATAALALRAALLRHAGRAEEAFRQAGAVLAIDPLDPLAARERRLARETGLSPEPSPLDALEAAALRSLDEDAYALEAAHDYARAGLLADAITLLEARLPKSDSRADPLVAYTLGWLHERNGRRRRRSPRVRPRPRAAVRLRLPVPARERGGARARQCGRPEGPARPVLPRQPALRPAARRGCRGLGEGPRPRPEIRPRAPQPGVRVRSRPRRPRRRGREPAPGRRAGEEGAAALLRARPVPGLVARSARRPALPAQRESRHDRPPRDHPLAAGPRAAAARPARGRARDAGSRPFPRVGRRARESPASTSRRASLRAAPGSPRATPPRRSPSSRRRSRYPPTSRSARPRAGSSRPRTTTSRWPSRRSAARTTRSRRSASPPQRRRRLPSATTGSAARSRGSGARPRRAATSSGSRPLGRGASTRRARSSCAWLRRKTSPTRSTSARSVCSASHARPRRGSRSPGRSPPIPITSPRTACGAR